MSQGTKRNVTNVVASLLGYAVPLLVNFASTPYLIKSLGEDAFGIQVLVNVVIGYLALMDLGIGLPLIKYLAEDKAKGDMKSASELLGTTLVLYIGLGLAGMLVAMVASDYLANNFFSIPEHFRGEAKIVFQLAAAGFFATLLMGWGRSVAMGLQRYEVAYAISALSSVLGVGVGLYLIHAGFGVVGYVSSKVFFLFIAGLAYYVIYKVFLPEYNIAFRFNRSVMVRIRSYLTYGIIHRGVSGFTSSIDKTFLGIWVGAASVGVYSVPYMITNSVNYLVAAMLGYNFPSSSALHSTGEHEKLRKSVVNVSRYLVMLSCVIYLPLFLLGQSFLTLWIGEEFAIKTIFTFDILLLASFITLIFTAVMNSTMMGIGRVDVFTYYMIIKMIVFVMWCFFLIPSAGIEGAALSVLITCLVDVIYFGVVILRYLQIQFTYLFFKSYFKPLSLLLILCLVNMLFEKSIDSWLLLLSLFFVITAILVLLFLLFGVIHKKERDGMKKLLLLFFKKNILRFKGNAQGRNIDD